MRLLNLVGLVIECVWVWIRFVAIVFVILMWSAGARY
jgi:hypothetical protein